MKKIKTAYFETGDIIEFGYNGKHVSRSYRNRVISRMRNDSYIRPRPRVRFARGWTRKEVRKEFVWW